MSKKKKKQERKQENEVLDEKLNIAEKSDVSDKEEPIVEPSIDEKLAIEKDKNFIPILKDIEKVYPNRLEIIEQDALTFNLESLNDISNLKIISNLPYNIGTKLLINWLQPKIWPPIWRDMTLMFQKEVADRIVADVNSSKYGRLTILAEWKMNAKKIMVTAILKLNVLTCQEAIPVAHEFSLVAQGPIFVPQK